ncbi:SDR family NAD(P)-dependent oxidoreductase [Embleya scabrispora]|uniref:SDR family NAD(P)-dependent oxidoreductase n=1 Tax=Embleya scabrispora TaxID=159449 RepID=UPI001F31782C|nr:SDR family NAD(P)-dependent oxidoreductase [Embleya scabrispora]
MLVTGGSRGLGLLIAREFARLGARVTICARDEEELVRAAALIRDDTGRSVAWEQCDLSDAQAVDALVAAVTKRHGPVEVLVNNAGIITVGPLATLDVDAFRRAIEVMFMAPVRLTLAVLPGMRERGDGRVINVTSIGGRIAAPHLLPYDCAKFAATGFSEGLRAELAGSGVSVTTAVPGLMRTGSHRAARFTGRRSREYAWFAAAASLPLVSMDAERAARLIVRAGIRRRPELVLTAVAKVAVRAHGLAPATTTRVLSLAARLLPSADSSATSRETSGSSEHAKGTPWTDRVAALGERAAHRWNEPGTS